MIMSAQVGITTYKDLLNKKNISKLNEAIQGVCINFKKLANDTAIENRESDKYEEYVPQYTKDLQSIVDLRNYASIILNLCDEINFNISRRSIEQHIYNWDDED